MENDEQPPKTTVGILRFLIGVSYVFLKKILFFRVPYKSLQQVTLIKPQDLPSGNLT